jgi:hypothetical protein
MSHINKKEFERGLRVADSHLFEEDKIWSRYSNDKVDIGETLAAVIRTLHKALPLKKGLSALSIGSSNEPQFRILETNFRRGLYLWDIEKEALEIVRERLARQSTGHVRLIRDDFDRCFLSAAQAVKLLKNKLGNEKKNLITLHHSLYYCADDLWKTLFDNLYRYILAPEAAIHAVLMSCRPDMPYTTGWLYDHFVGRFFGEHNEQDLTGFKKELRQDRLYSKCRILSKTSKVRFFVNDFEQFMAVAWMVLLYPSVHRYNLSQREEITEFIYKNFWEKKRPLWQLQDHLVIYRGINLKGLI